MYKLQNVVLPSGEVLKPNAIIRSSDGATIPFDPANTDYQKFKSDILGGAELQDADGNLMTADEAKSFISNLS